MSGSNIATNRDFRLQQWLPGVHANAEYRREDLRGDFILAIVRLAAIPSATAYADLAGTTPIVGLYAVLAGLIVYALFGSSRHVRCGPGSIAGNLARRKRACFFGLRRRPGDPAFAHVDLVPAIGHHRWTYLPRLSVMSPRRRAPWADMET